MKPFLWLCEIGNGVYDSTKEKACHRCFPVYTAPRELSDEEIEELWDLIMFKTAGDWEEDLNIKFARAILKKASEK